MIESIGKFLVVFGLFIILATIITLVFINYGAFSGIITLGVISLVLGISFIMYEG